MENKLSENEVQEIGYSFVKMETRAPVVISGPVNNSMSKAELFEIMKIPLLYLEGKDEFFLMQNSNSTGIKNHFLYFASYGYSTEIQDENNIDEKTLNKILDIATLVKEKLQEIDKNGNTQNCLERLYPQNGAFNIYSLIYPGEKIDKEKVEEKLIYPYQKYDFVREMEFKKLSKTGSDDYICYLVINVEAPNKNLRSSETVEQTFKGNFARFRDFILSSINQEKKQEQKDNQTIPPKQKPKLKL